MRVSVRAMVFSACALAAAGEVVRAQSLADVARKEEERRKDVKGPSKVYTNKDLHPVPPPPPAPETASKEAGETGKAGEAGKAGEEGKAGEAGKAGKSGEAEGAPKRDAKSAEKAPVRDQAYWSGRMKDLQIQLDRDQVYADALQSRINALTADFSARDDPAQRDAIGRDRQRALAELDRLTQSIQTDKTAVADLEEEARRAAVPAGWLR
jgi:hypothetical protein